MRRYGITDGNRQTLTLGMTMPQLINPYRFGLFQLLYDSESPEGETLIEFADKEWKKEKHVGETPTQVNSEIIEAGNNGKMAINLAKNFISKNKDELERLENDVNCYSELAGFFEKKTRAALEILKYKYSNNISDLDSAYTLLTSSIKDFILLTGLTNNSYLYANSMQTQQRKIPMRGVNGTYKHWKEMLPVYEKGIGSL